MTLLVAALAVVLSFAMGLSLGLLGGGGSILAVPILTYVLGVETRSAIATSLVVVGATSAVGLARHARLGAVRWKTGMLFAVMSMTGAYAGGHAAAWVPAPLLLLLLAGMMVATAIAMLRPASPTRARAPQRSPAAPAVVAQAVGLGAFTGLVGAGGGFLVVPALFLLGGLSMREAIGTSLLVIALNTLAGFAALARHATVEWTLVGVVTGVAAVGAVAGGMLSARVPQVRLRRGFACLVLALAVLLVVEQLPVGTRSALAPWWPLWLAALATAAAALCRRIARVTEPVGGVS